MTLESNFEFLQSVALSFYEKHFDACNELAINEEDLFSDVILPHYEIVMRGYSSERSVYEEHVRYNMYRYMRRYLRRACDVKIGNLEQGFWRKSENFPEFWRDSSVLDHSILIRRAEGYTISEISAMEGKSPRTISREIAALKEKYENEQD